MPEVVKFAAAYFAVAWIVAFIAGSSGERDGDAVATMSLLWPLSIPAILLFMSALFIADFIDNRPKLRRVLSKTGHMIGRFFTALASLLYCAALIFRPQKLGLIVRSLFKRRRGAACTQEQ